MFEQDRARAQEIRDIFRQATERQDARRKPAPGGASGDTTRRQRGDQ